MEIEIRADSISLDGYVNAVGRDSKIITDDYYGIEFVEQIRPGAFNRALDKNNEIFCYLDHIENRKLSSTNDRNLELKEDSIGLKIHTKITDTEVIQKAKENKLRGWSFGFIPTGVTRENTEHGYIRQIVDSLELLEVSVIDDSAIPAYDGTLIETRFLKDGRKKEFRFSGFVPVIESPKEDLNKKKNIIKNLWRNLYELEST